MTPVALATLNLPGAAAPSNESVGEADLFARILVKELRSSLPEGGWLGGGDFQVFETLLDEQLSAALAPALERSFTKGRNAGPPRSAPALRGSAGPLEGKGTVSSGFGLRVDPLDGTHRHHDGVDIAAPRGTPIRAARAGRVVRAESADGYGKLVVLDHGAGLETRYAHCESIEVRAGDQVAAGALLGRVGDSGRATGPHLHFEVRRDGQPVDPHRAGLLRLPTDP